MLKEQKDLTRVYNTNEELCVAILSQSTQPSSEIISRDKDITKKFKELGLDPKEHWTWKRCPDIIVVNYESKHVRIVECKTTKPKGGSVEEKLVNPVWKEVYWPKVFKGSGWTFNYEYMLTGFVGRTRVLELMDAIGEKYIHTEEENV